MGIILAEDYPDSYHDDPGYLTQPRSRKNLSSLLALLLIAVVGTFYVQTTLAANISLNSSAPIQFGQGTLLTTACSGSSVLTITPTATFVNSSGAGAFKLSSITVEGIPGGCSGYDLTINAYGDSTNTPVALFNSTSTSAVVYDNAGTFELDSSVAGATITSGSGSFTITFTNPVSLTSEVSKITMQSSSHALSCSQGGACSVDQTGPGGGTVFYYQAAGFSCGASLSSTCYYLEVAPKTWSGGSIDPIKPWSISPYNGTNISGIADAYLILRCSKVLFE